MIKVQRITGMLCICAVIAFVSSCGKEETIMKPYNVSSKQSEFSIIDSADLSVGKPFAADLAVVSSNVISNEVNVASPVASIYCIDNGEILYAKNVHERMNPASITKIMTALVALENGNLEDIVTVTEGAMITESDATLCDLKVGDQLTLEQLLNGSLIKSGNDAAAAIAIHIGGTVEGFCQMMNDKAKAIGATNTNFTNPHGLTDENHYTTAYDLYLILNEAMKYDKFLEIINQSTYTLEYTDSEGKQQSREFTSTNRFLTQKATAPEGITVIGGKTGTTKAAGSCLALLSKDSSGKWYCSIVLKAEGTDIVFEEMSDLLTLEK